jgi:hypothetical protein
MYKCYYETLYPTITSHIMCRADINHYCTPQQTPRLPPGVPHPQKEIVALAAASSASVVVLAYLTRFPSMNPSKFTSRASEQRRMYLAVYAARQQRDIT